MQPGDHVRGGDRGPGPELSRGDQADAGVTGLRAAIDISTSIDLLEA
jgi:hypothetical protein